MSSNVPGHPETANPMSVARDSHTATLLPSGKLLVAGGEGPGALTSAELFTPVVRRYTFSGFQQPIDNGVPNTANAGQTIPVKWRLTDISTGAPISDPGSFVSVTSSPSPNTCGGTADAIETYSGQSGLQYLGDGNWQFNWKTPKDYAGQCRTMSLNLSDGTTGTAAFVFK